MSLLLDTTKADQCYRTKPVEFPGAVPTSTSCAAVAATRARSPNVPVLCKSPDLSLRPQPPLAPDRRYGAEAACAAHPLPADYLPTRSGVPIPRRGVRAKNVLRTTRDDFDISKGKLQLGDTPSSSVRSKSLVVVMVCGVETQSI